MKISKKQLLTALVVVGGFAGAQAQAACPYPTAPGKFPDGSAASKEEMLAAKKTVVQYNTDMEAYLACLDKEFEETLAAQPDIAKDKKADLEKKQAQKHNAAVDAVTENTERFNEQLRAYQAKAKAAAAAEKK
jgi:hypothetical protein